MAEGESRGEKSDATAHASPHMTPLNASTELRASSTSPSTRANRWKLSRSASKGWFNKSFDQSTLSKSVPPHPRTFRRQSSVSDFFQSVLTKSRSHLIGLFSGNSKKGNTRHSMLDISGQVGSPTKNAGVSPKREQLSDAHNENAPNYLFTSKPSSPDNTARSPSTQSSPSGVSRSDLLDLKDKSLTKGHTSPVDMFIVSSNNDPKKASLNKTNSPSKHSSQSLDSQNEEKQRPTTYVKSELFSGSQTRRQQKTSNQPHLAHSSSITFSFLDFTENGHDDLDDELEKLNSQNYRQISSAPGGCGRQSLSTEVSFLKTGEEKTKVITKRALAKSNSDTITKFSADLAPITKASSDGNCFLATQTKSPISGSVAAKITDYLFVGSVEAAYNEPLLCKYKITSLIDMTNIQPRVVPLNKKSDCPCACINKDHFRSKLNIGVDDIEWENLEQYFKEINTFIEGSRKKKGRTLIFSYWGKSRAPAAAMQHLMHHYGMSYRDAFKMVVSKWPTTKLNPGFIKTLKRLEVNLSQRNETIASTISTSPLRSHNTTCLVERGVSEVKNEHISEIMPPVVRGAWLEC